jgi:hypothetical protein
VTEIGRCKHPEVELLLTVEGDRSGVWVCRACRVELRATGDVPKVTVQEYIGEATIRAGGQERVVLGRASSRATDAAPPPHLPASASARKDTPIASGVIDYFPDALVAIAQLSFIGNKQHNPGHPLHWARGKSTDEADALLRHFLDRGTVDSDGVRHTTKVAWRALALLQKELEDALREGE